MYWQRWRAEKQWRQAGTRGQARLAHAFAILRRRYDCIGRESADRSSLSRAIGPRVGINIGALSTTNGQHSSRQTQQVVETTALLWEHYLHTGAPIGGR